MNQGRIWCVVNPTVGLPLFLGSVAVTSLIVHYSVLSNTTWFGAYWNGHAKPKAVATEAATAPVAMATPSDASGYTVSIAPVADKVANAGTSFVITVAPKVVAAATADAADRSHDTVALASPDPK
jgi:light-harvesting protein B-800-850 alpha chain